MVALRLRQRHDYVALWLTFMLTAMQRALRVLQGAVEGRR